MAVMRHFNHGMYSKRVTKVMNPGTVMIPDIRNATLGQKLTEPFINSLCIAIGTVTFNKEKTVR
jgi:hypothetical protein